jgi:prepilin-type N-terminal cleavage/methylation domain-containing protein
VTPRSSQTQAGFTLIEVMVAVLITAIAAIGFIAMYMTETKAGSFTRHSTEASMLANSKLEALRGVPTATFATAGNANDTVDAQGNTGGMYIRRWSWTTYTSTAPANSYVELTVAVGWDEDETAVACASDASCRSGFCMPTSVCASRAVFARGRRN